MVSWSEVESAEPAFATVVRAIFDTSRHKTMATPRADGAPRISGIEAEFRDGELRFGSMPGSRKGADLARDGRFALHSGSVDPPEDAPSEWPGDAKIAGRALLTGALGGDQPGDGFRADIGEVVCTRVVGDELMIELWRPGHPLRRFTRG